MMQGGKVTLTLAGEWTALSLSVVERKFAATEDSLFPGTSVDMGA
jgi:hypothetical protein